MESSQVIIWMIMGCVFLLIFAASDVAKKILRILVCGVAGCAAIWILNILLASEGIVIGINPLNAFVIGLLGLPGAALLYAVKFLL